MIIEMKLTSLTVVAIAVLSFSFARTSSAEDDEPKPCGAADIKAAKNFTPTGSQLKTYVDATVEIHRAAQTDKAIADVVSATKESADYSCKIDDNTTALSPAGAQKLFTQYPQIAKIYSSRNISPRELSAWAVIAVPLAMSIDPQFGAFARDALTPQQVAFAKQNADELRRLMKAMPRSN
jgi:hypothetical protein